MFPHSDNIFTSRRAEPSKDGARAPLLMGNALIAAAAVLVAGGLIAACSSAPVKMECKEIQMRVDYGDLSADQLRFAMQELEECKTRVKAAEAKDSTFIDRTEQRFTPETEP